MQARSLWCNVTMYQTLHWQSRIMRILPGRPGIDQIIKRVSEVPESGPKNQPIRLSYWILRECSGEEGSSIDM